MLAVGDCWEINELNESYCNRIWRKCSQNIQKIPYLQKAGWMLAALVYEVNLDLLNENVVLTRQMECSQIPV